MASTVNQQPPRNDSLPQRKLSSQPNLLDRERLGSTHHYKAPRGQSFFMSKQRIRKIFDDPEYVKNDNQSDLFRFGADDFGIQDIYQYYFNKQYRYPIQAFMDMYFFDLLQDFKQKQEDVTILHQKSVKVSQLSQKLFNLNLLEERLLIRKQILLSKMQ